MARGLSVALDAAQLSTKRAPAYQILAYDVRSGFDTIGDIVALPESALNATTGPLDITDYVTTGKLDEKAGNYATNGIPSSSFEFTMNDPNNQFDPQNVQVSPTSDGRFLRRNNVIRVIEGDSRVPQSEWVITFTGLIAGQAGVKRTRVGEATAEIRVKCLSREAGFLKFNAISDSFAISTSYLSMATSIAENLMGLDSAEIDFAGFGSLLTGQVTTQLVDINPLVMLAQVMFADGFLPRFNGDGTLSQSQGNITQAPSRVYTNDNLFLEIDRPLSQVNPINKVCVVGLSSEMSKATQPRQSLATVDITTGFFAQGEDFDIFWSDDHTILADNVSMITHVSVNGGAFGIGGAEYFTDIDGGTGEGTTGAHLVVGTGYLPYIVVFWAIQYVVLAALPDAVVSFGGGSTISVGRLIQAISAAVMQILMSKVGRGNYEWRGDPFEYVFAEIRACAVASSLQTHELNEKVITNHLVNTLPAGRNIARDILFREQARGNPRRITMIPDLMLEPDDSFETANGRRYLIESVSRVLERNTPAATATINAYETSAGAFV